MDEPKRCGSSITVPDHPPSKLMSLKSCVALLLAITALLSACQSEVPPPESSLAAVAPSESLPKTARKPSTDEFLKDMRESQIMILSYVYAKSEEAADPAAARLAVLEESIGSQLKSLATATPDGVQHRILDQLDDSSTNYWLAVKETIALKQAQRNTLAEATLFGLVSQYAAEQEQIIQRLEIEKQRKVAG